MDIVGKARQLERKIARSVDAAVVEFVGRKRLEPLEIIHAVLDHAERQVQETGRGRRVFPFNRLIVHVLVPHRDRDARARFAAVVDGPPSLPTRIQDRLQSAGCKLARPIVEIVYASKAGASWLAPEFHVEFHRDAAVPPREAPTARPPQIKLIVVAGRAAQRVYVFSTTRVDIGRRADVLDARQQLVRTNQVAFEEDGPDVNRTVSRRHAHVEYVDGAYRLCDDRSAQGTRILREGRMITVPAGPRGVRLQTSDHILLGQARLRLTIEPSGTAP
ncbi:MAG TPA: FHA domain-containing protein [Vicinamibacterales bacterium]|nr:FHA domain-containing protein [Vicinamibacterales bacterium]